MPRETAVELSASNIRYGFGVTHELGQDLAENGTRLAMVITDPNLARLAPLERALEAIHDAGVDYKLFDRAQVEPTDESFKEAIAFAQTHPFDAFVAVGGGSAMDTAKAANLYSTWPADFLDYVNPPIGRGLPPPGPLRPLYAVPTTAGTGSETTGTSIFDFKAMHTKTGIAHRRLKPTLGLLDPLNLRTMPASVAAATGLDVLSHAIESYTAIPYTEREAAPSPNRRPAYQGSNPISDVWSLESLRMVRDYLIRAVANPEDDEARGMMMLASAYAGIGFGNAGCHLPHGMSYPVSSRVREWRAPGYPQHKAMIPHGFSVILNAPAVFRFTAPACPDRHLAAAEALGAKTARVAPEDAGKVLADTIVEYMERLGVPNGLRAVGYTSEDIPALVEGTIPQHRVTKLSPRPATEEDLAAMFEDAMTAW
jgi:hydroxyacid-oxoacid transhydrogenase